MDDGSGSFADIILDVGDDFDNGNSATPARNSSSVSVASQPTGHASSSAAEDVAPVYILQPKEIIQNIDLMKTVGKKRENLIFNILYSIKCKSIVLLLISAILLENRLQTSNAIKRLDLEKLKELQNDIERFPEAFQKFSSIIHQIQYLNVTSDWNFSCEESMPSHSASGRLGTSLMSRLFGSERPNIDPALAQYDARKQVMIHLLQMLQQIFSRYLKIQTMLEERLKKFTELLLHAERYHKQRSSATGPGSDSENDDPNMPLLVTHQRPRVQHGSVGISAWLLRADSMNNILKKTKRSSSEVKDSMDVLNDLILWDYKQVTQTVNNPPATSVPQAVSSNGKIFRTLNKSSHYVPKTNFV